LHHLLPRHHRHHHYHTALLLLQIHARLLHPVRQHSWPDQRQLDAQQHPHPRRLLLLLQRQRQLLSAP
jgi:hypothetical protein